MLNQWSWLHAGFSLQATGGCRLGGIRREGDTDDIQIYVH